MLSLEFTQNRLVGVCFPLPTAINAAARRFDATISQAHYKGREVKNVAGSEPWSQSIEYTKDNNFLVLKLEISFITPKMVHIVFLVWF